MPPKTQSIEAARAQFAKASKDSGPKWIERELTKGFSEFQTLCKYLQDNPEARDCDEGTRLIFPMPPNMLNSSFSTTHWANKRELKNQYKCNCEALRALGFVPPPPRTMPVLVRISVHFVVWNQCDADNLCAREKWPIDVLARWRWFRSDAPTHLQRKGLPTQTVCHRTPQRIEITIHPEPT
jgi:hypothetical protein